MTPPGEIIDDAVAALGGEDTEFYLNAGMLMDGTPNAKPCVTLNCCYDDCEWGYSIGQQELWEFVADAREHWEEKHAAKS